MTVSRLMFKRRFLVCVWTSERMVVLPQRLVCDHCDTNFYVRNTLDSMGLVCSCCYVLSPPPIPSSATPSGLEYYYSARIAEMIEKMKRNPEIDKVESDVEASKVAGRTELSPIVLVGDELAVDNLQVFRSLQAQYPRGLFKGWTEREWELGKRIAEGGQAELFELWRIDPDGRRVEEVPWVIKLFKDGLRLHDLQKQLPRGILGDENTLWHGHFDGGVHCNSIEGAMLFNGRFGIMMKRKWGDLRKLIDTRMIHNNMCGPPFTSDASWCMLSIGMETLHARNITHGGLKAANVLVSNDSGSRDFDPIHNGDSFVVADYECSVGVVGTGFWRAPEILLAVKNQNVTAELFTKASDVYSMG